MTPKAILVGLEAKNIREWLYPQREEITELLQKCTAVDAVPVLVARRIHFSTFRVLNPCGVVLHQTYNRRSYIYLGVCPPRRSGLSTEPQGKEAPGGLKPIVNM